MTFIEETVMAPDGLRLYSRRHELEESRGEIVIVHGFGEHSGRYGCLTSHLVSRRYSVTAYDHRGHGLSDGRPGHVDRFGEYEDDLHQVLVRVHSRRKSAKIFIIGHSMGGLITLRYLAREPKMVAGGVISAPLIAVAAHVPVHKLMIARVGARIAPRLQLGNEIDPSVLSRDIEVGNAYAADPLVNRVVSPRWFNEATRAMDEAKQLAPLITAPLLIMHGTDDKLASVDATKKFFELIGSADKQLAIFQGYYHELFNEPEKRQIFEQVSEWLDRRV